MSGSDHTLQRTWGVDLSTDPRKVGLVSLTWDGEGPANVEEPWGNGVKKSTPHREALASLIAAHPTDVWDVDVPFGWPVGLAGFLTRHAQGVDNPFRVPATELAAASHHHGPRPWDHLARRVTDHEAIRRLPSFTGFSVSFDKLGATAAAWADIEQLLRANGVRFSRDGREGYVVETWPSACWRVLGLQGNPAKLMPEDFARRLHGIVSLTPDLTAMTADTKGGHSRDAIVCALAARATQLGLTRMPSGQHLTPAHLEAIDSEGWIHLPNPGVSLHQLVTGAPK